MDRDEMLDEQSLEMPAEDETTLQDSSLSDDTFGEQIPTSDDDITTESLSEPASTDEEERLYEE